MPKYPIIRKLDNVHMAVSTYINQEEQMITHPLHLIMISVILKKCFSFKVNFYFYQLFLWKAVIFLK